MIKLGLSIDDTEVTVNDELPPLDDIDVVESDTKMDEVD